MEDLPVKWRDSKGRWLPGNPGGGNPYAARVNELRNAFLAAVTPEDINEITANLLKLCKEATSLKDLAPALDLLWSRLWGKPHQELAVAVHQDTAPPVNLDNLSPAELRQWLSLTEKAALPCRTVPEPCQAPLDAG